MQKLTAGFARMEETKATLLQGLAPLSPEILNQRPDPASWSILQVIAHLTRSEAGTLQYIEKKTQNPDALPRAGVVPWLRIAVLVAGIHSPFKFKAPGPLGDVPETGDLKTMSFAWAEVREDWRQFVETFPPVLEDRTIFRHPFVGLLGPAQVMIFLNEHLGNHVRQIARIRKALGA